MIDWVLEYGKKQRRDIFAAFLFLSFLFILGEGHISSVYIPFASSFSL